MERDHARDLGVDLHAGPTSHDGYAATATAPGSGENPGWGPAGPAGVSLLIGSEVFLSLDVLTGRLAALDVGRDLDPSDLELLASVLDTTSVKALARPGAAEHRQVEVLEVTARRQVTLAAHLEDAATRLPMPAGSVARALLAAERATVLTDLHREASTWVNDELVRQAQQLAELSVDGMDDGELATLLPRGASIHGVATAAADLERQLPPPLATGPVGVQLRRWAAALVPSPELPGEGVALEADAVERDERALRDAQDAVEAAPLLGPGRPVPRMVTRDGDLVAHEPAPRAIGDGRVEFEPGEVRPFGLAPVAGVQPADGPSWWTVSFERLRTTVTIDAGTDGALSGPVTWESGVPVNDPAWITLVDAQGSVVGAGQLRYRDRTASVDIAVSAAPTSLFIGHHPFRRGLGWYPSHPGDATAEGAERVTKVGHWAALTGRPELALECFARAVIAWLEQGDVFRAAWAWSLADHVHLELTLDEIDPGLVAALRAVSSSGDIPPDGIGERLIGAWAWAADLDALLNAPLPHDA